MSDSQIIYKGHSVVSCLGIHIPNLIKGLYKTGMIFSNLF